MPPSPKIKTTKETGKQTGKKSNKQFFLNSDNRPSDGLN